MRVLREFVVSGVGEFVEVVDLGREVAGGAIVQVQSCLADRLVIGTADDEVQQTLFSGRPVTAGSQPQLFGGPVLARRLLFDWQGSVDFKVAKVWLVDEVVQAFGRARISGFVESGIAPAGTSATWVIQEYGAWATQLHLVFTADENFGVTLTPTWVPGESAGSAGPVAFNANAAGYLSPQGRVTSIDLVFNNAGAANMEVTASAWATMGGQVR